MEEPLLMSPCVSYDVIASKSSIATLDSKLCTRPSAAWARL